MSILFIKKILHNFVIIYCWLELLALVWPVPLLLFPCWPRGTAIKDKIGTWTCGDVLLLLLLLLLEFELCCCCVCEFEVDWYCVAVEVRTTEVEHEAEEEDGVVRPVDDALETGLARLWFVRGGSVACAKFKQKLIK